MFSFLSRWFKKSPKDDDKEADEGEKLTNAKPEVIYSKDFAKADEIAICAVDCARPNVEAIQYNLVRPEEIQPIVDLLEDIPEEGDSEKEIDPCSEHTLTALKENQPFANITFYEGKIKLPNGKFISNNEKFLATEAKLFELIKIDLNK